MSDKQIKTKLEQLLQKAFQNHDVECEVKDGKLFFPQQLMLLTADYYETTSSQAVSVQLDIDLEIGVGRSICESFGGIGNHVEDALENAVANFLVSSFHPLLSAFFTDKYDQEINREVWTVGNSQYNVYMSNLVCRGTTPEPDKANQLPALLADIVKTQTLSEGVHWVRLFMGQYDHKQTTEILLDNQPWEAVLPDVQKIDFPLSENYFSARIFAVLQSGMEISRLASQIGWMALEDKYDDEVVEVLREKGYSFLEAQKINIYIPLAFGRVLIKKQCDVRFSDEAIVIDTDEVVKLNDEPIFVKAYQLAEQIMEHGCMDTELFGAIAMCSAEVNAYSQALEGGNSIEDMAGASFGATQISFAE